MGQNITAGGYVETHIRLSMVQKPTDWLKAGLQGAICTIQLLSNSLTHELSIELSDNSPKISIPQIALYELASRFENIVSWKFYGDIDHYRS